MNAIHRRAALQLLASLATILPTRALAQNGHTPAPSINPGRLQQSLVELSKFGRRAGGTFADGVSRVAYSDADVAGRAYASS